MKIFGLPFELAILFFVVFVCPVLAVIGAVTHSICRGNEEGGRAFRE